MTNIVYIAKSTKNEQNNSQAVSNSGRNMLLNKPHSLGSIEKKRKKKEKELER
jgi:hypothetical protein